MAQIVGSMIFISSLALKCIMSASKDDLVLYECGNPVLPTFWVSFFLLMR